MKRLIACLLVLSTVFSLMMAMPVIADDTDYNMQNVEYAAKVLSGLDIYKKSSSASNQITRLDFVTALYEIINSNNTFPFDENNVKFITDVTDGDKKYVELALKRGLIKKPADGKFNPDGTVDMDFAAYAFAAMLGYFPDLQAESHLNRAQIMGLLKGVQNYGALTYADFVLMLYNMLDANFLEQVSYGSENKFDVSEETVLEHFFGLEKFNARFIANSYTDLSDAINMADGCIALQRAKDGIIETYKCSYDYSEELLGRNLVVYYNTKDKAVVYMIVTKKDECLAEINGSDFLGFEKSDRKLYYQKMTSGSRWEESYKSDYVTIPVNVDVIYNGQFTQNHQIVFDILENKSNLNIGKVAVYDINGDSKADLLKVDAYSNILVEAVNDVDKTISDSLSGTRTVLDENVIDGIVRIQDTAGESINLSQIKKNDVASVYTGMGKNPLIRVVVCNKTKNEYLISSYEKDDRQYIKTENTEYTVSAELAASEKDIAPGREVTLGLDHMGYIVRVTGSDAVYNNIGSVVEMKILGTFTKKLEIRIYTANGEFVTYTTADKLYADDNKVTVTDDSWTYVDKRGATINLLKELQKGIIQFRVNSADEINRIYFPSKESRDGILTYSAGMARPEEVFDNPKKFALRYKTNGKYFIPNASGTDVMNFVALASGAKIMTVPSANIIIDREKYYKISSSIKNDTKATAVGYTFTEGSMKSDLVVIVNEGSVSIESSSYYIVKDVYSSLNSDNSAVLTIDCMNSSGNVSTFVGEDVAVPQCDPDTGKIINQKVELNVGDVIKVALGATGEISAVGKMYDSVTKTGTLLNPTYWYANKRFVYASVYDVDDNVVSYVVGKDIVTEPAASE